MRRRVVLAALATMTVSACVGSPDVSGEPALEVFGPYRDEEADRFAEVLRRFETDNRVDVRYTGSVDFVADLLQRAGEGNDPPDVAIVPQPGVIERLAADGRLAPLGSRALEVVDEYYDADRAAFGVFDGVAYAVPFRLTMKSLVWYRPDVWEEHGWEIPATLDELAALVDRIAAAGEMAPWCFSIQAGSASGWAATDWTEDLVVRTAGVETYRRWAAGELPFSSDPIAAAFARFRSLVLDPGRSAGGLTAVIELPVSEAPQGLLAAMPTCAMLKQADFAINWMPNGTSVALDGEVDFFLLPPDDAAGGAPLVVGGDQFVQFSDEPLVDRLMAYLASPEAGEIWVRRGGFVSANPTIGPDEYPDGFTTRLRQVLDRTDVVVFDASDQLPQAIGSGVLWSEITRWVANVIAYPEFAEIVDAALAAELGVADVGG